MRYFRLLLCSTLLLISSCGDHRQVGNDLTESALPVELPAKADLPGSIGIQLPQDQLLPWEEMSGGFVDPDSARFSSAINLDSEFWRGVDAWQTAGDASNSGQALRLGSGVSGSGQRSHAIYRIPLAGENPAVLSTDINLRLRSDGSPSDYYIGIANYNSGRWDYHGPFSDGRIRLPLSEAAWGDYISGLGNTFVAVVAYDGSDFDIVGIGLNQLDPADTNPPPAPTGLSSNPVAGGLELQWNTVVAADLAGYRIYHSSNAFVNPGSAGVRILPYLEGNSRHVLQGLEGQTFVAVSAVDLNGNESDPVFHDNTALPGETPVLELLADSSSGLLGGSIMLSASGAQSYDWDLDGDGLFEITGDASGSQAADTGKAGIIRPAVRASSGGGEAVALGAVSLVISQDLPPVAMLSADRTQADIVNGETDPATINFDASASYDDGGSLEYSWNLLGNDAWSGFQVNDTMSQDYGSSGMYTAIVRVQDSAGQQAIALLPILIRQVGGFRETMIDDYAAANVISLAVVDGHPAVFMRQDGPLGDLTSYCRALDPEGHKWGDPIPMGDPDVSFSSDLAVINGRPAVVWVDNAVGGIMYRRADNSTGQTAADWSLPAVAFTGQVNTFGNPRLRDINGNPGVCWVQDLDDLYYMVAAGNAGESLSDWSNPAVKVVTGNVDAPFDMELIAGQPAIAYIRFDTFEAKYIRATGAGGATPADWPIGPATPSDPDFVVGRIKLAEIGGNPAITYFQTDTDGLRYVRCLTSDGNDNADWPDPVDIEANFNTGNSFHDLAEIGGLPAVATNRPAFGNLTVYTRAADLAGTSWSNFQQLAPIASPEATANKNINLVNLNGHPAAVVLHETADRWMFYTYGFSN